MTVAAVVRPPLPHRATLERNVEEGLSPTRAPLPPRFELVDPDLRCVYWEPERAVDGTHAGLREGPNAVLFALGPRMLVRQSADIKIADRVTEVRAGSAGLVISAQPMRVVEVLWRRSHMEVGLELVSSGPIQEAGS